MKGIEGFTLGRYELRRRIAQGGMAEVYLGYDRRVKRQVAIKVLYGRDEAFVRRFEREALAVGRLSHDHILPLYDFGEQSPWYYLVMPYVEGGTLREYLMKRKRLTLEEAASFLDQIASALQHAHDQGVIHRDVKPSNIMLRLDGYAYLVDFGLAKAMMGGEALTNSGAMIGTPEYMAPEQSNGANDYRSDIYSLGVILYQMLTGQLPFTAESPVAVSLKHIQSTPIAPRQLNNTIPQSIEQVILKAMAKDPNERYQEAQAFSVAYWKALHTEQQKMLKENNLITIPLPIVEEGEEEEGLPAITQILPETERDMIQPFPTKVRYPLEVSVPAPTKAENTTPKKARQIKLAATLCTLLLLLILPLTLLQTPPQTHAILKSRTLADRHAVKSSPTPDFTATAQAENQALLAQRAQAQATAGITSSIGAGNVLYHNDLTNPLYKGGWINDQHQCSFSSQGYAVQTFHPYTAAWCYSNQIRVSSVVITAQARLIRGDSYGMVFRLNASNQAFYVLEINSNGDYRFVRADGNNPTHWLILIDWTPNNAIQNVYQQNTFLIVATGSEFRFYLNRQFVASFIDSTYSSGFVGFFVGGDSAGGTKADFSNLWIFQR